MDALSRRAPSIVIGTLCAALVAYWAEAPLWVPYGLAVVAFVVARGFRSVLAALGLG